MSRWTRPEVLDVFREQFFVRPVSQHLHQGRIDGQEPAIQGDLEDAVRGVPNQLAVGGFGAAELVLHPAKVIGLLAELGVGGRDVFRALVRVTGELDREPAQAAQDQAEPKGHLVEDTC